MATPYKDLTDGLLSRLRSSGIPNITEEQLDSMLADYIRPAIIKFKVCKQDLSDRNDDLAVFNIDLTDEEKEILILFMLVEYLSANYINVPSLLRQNLTSKDFKVFSSAEHLYRLTELRSVYEKEARQMVSAYSNIGSNLFDVLKAKSSSTEQDEG